jgi:quercetin dioxygenase-like cupin family protein
MSDGTELVGGLAICAAAEPFFAVVGTVLQFVSTPEQCGADLSVMRCGIPAGAVIPIHSHSDPEVFYLLEGSVDVFQDSGTFAGWRTASGGDVVTISGGIRHALRNPNPRPVITVLISQSKLYRFFRELAQPINPGDQPPRPSPAVMESLFALAARYSFWIGSPSENAAIGLSVE